MVPRMQPFGPYRSRLTMLVVCLGLGLGGEAEALASDAVAGDDQRASARPEAADQIGVELFMEALENAVQAALGAAPDELRARQEERRAAARSRREQLERQARHVEQLLQPLLRAELEMVRSICEDLTSEARREVLEAARGEVERLAQEMAAQQIAGNPATSAGDPRSQLHGRIITALAAHVTADTLDSYRQEHDQRVRRRAEAARVRIVAKLDARLDLDAAQREAILADLREGWESSWLRELDDRGGLVINGLPVCPDYADSRIAPHLDPRQLELWRTWSRTAGGRMLGRRTNWHFDGQGLQPDAWWER
jgi:hypothetical protein